MIHCINSSDSKKCIVGEELTHELSDVLNDINIKDKNDIYWVEDSKAIQTPDWATNLRSSLDYSKNENLVETDNVTAKDTAFYIFTSGTTGVPKAAIFPNAKIVAASFNISNTGYRMTHEDRLYNCLPLYHSTGLMLGLAAVIHSGASVFVRRKFSASMFWKEAQKYQTTTFIYVGELCRYLSFQEPCEEEKNNPLRAMVGNVSPFFKKSLCAARIWWQLSLESLNGWKALGNLNASEVLERGVTLMCVCVFWECSGMG